MTRATIGDDRVCVTLIDAQPTPASVRDTVIRGLSERPRALPPWLFYDERGARLFERITELPEYYPTRTELGILERHIAEMADRIGPDARILEFGSGSGLKTRLLLEHLQAPAAYVPIDISREQLVRFALSVAHDFPAVPVMPVCADYTQHVPLPDTPNARRTVTFFPGSTLGNFERAEAEAFLRRVAELCGEGGGLLIGADLHKDSVVIERAYNDAAGVTAAFNRNMLVRINEETGADFEPDAFAHRAFYDAAEHRIEMRLEATRPMQVRIPAGDGTAGEFHFDTGDYIRTEYSHKYAPEDLAALAERTGWQVCRAWSDERRWFGVWLLKRA